jgi:hypothetical protein
LISKLGITPNTLPIFLTYDDPYVLNGFTYNLQDLVTLPYFGAPTSTSVNNWLSFQGESLGVCSKGP